MLALTFLLITGFAGGRVSSLAKKGVGAAQIRAYDDRAIGSFCKEFLRFHTAPCRHMPLPHLFGQEVYSTIEYSILCGNII